MAETGKRKQNIEPHPLVAALQPDPSKPPIRTVKLFGFPGKSMDPSMTRLWLDTDLLSYADIPSSAIHHSVELPDEGGTIVWLSPDAQVAFGSTTDAATVGQFLTGSIASSHLAGTASANAAGVQPGAVPEAMSLGGPCTSMQLCNPSNPCPSNHLICRPTVVCHSVVVACVSHPIACNVTAIVCPSHQIPCHPTVTACHSVVVVCVSHGAACNISAIECPSQLFGCPTRPIVCPQVSAVVVCPSRLCPSAAIPCFSAPCPSTGCPSVGCGQPGGFGGQ
jgi:hypothetical protein